jgi:hypothetical protein
LASRACSTINAPQIVLISAIMLVIAVIGQRMSSGTMSVLT